jgi:hypothetical protein
MRGFFAFSIEATPCGVILMRHHAISDKTNADGPGRL